MEGYSKSQKKVGENDLLGFDRLRIRDRRLHLFLGHLIRCQPFGMYPYQ